MIFYPQIIVIMTLEKIQHEYEDKLLDISHWYQQKQVEAKESYAESVQEVAEYRQRHIRNILPLGS